MRDFADMKDIPFEVKEELFNRITAARPEQTAMLRTLAWKRIDLDELKEQVRDVIARYRKGERSTAVGSHVCPWEHCCYLYLDFSTWRGEIIWDSRICTSPEQLLSVPHFVEHVETGAMMELFAISAAAPDYPIVQGERVFMELTEALAREEAAKMLRDLESSSPGMFEFVTKVHPTREAAIEVGMKRMREAGMACIEPAAAGLVESLAKQRAERPREREGPMVPVSVLDIEDEDDRFKLVHLIADRLAPYMRAHVGTTGGRWPLRTAEEAASSCVILRFIGPNDGQGEIPASVWFKCQQQSNTTQLPGVIDSERWTIRTKGGRRYQMELSLWWVGLEFSVFGEAAITMGPMLTQRILTPDGPEQFSRPAPYSYMWHEEDLAEAYGSFLSMRAKRDEGTARFKQTMERIDEHVNAGMPIERVRDLINLSSVETVRRTERARRRSANN